MKQSKLFILKQEIELLWTDMQYDRELRMSGKPASEVLGGQITVCFATRPDTDLVLRWMTKESEDETMQELDRIEEGEVRFYGDGFDYPPTKTYYFNDALPVSFKEVFSANGENPFQTMMTISPAIQNYGAEHIKTWNINYVEPTEETHTPAEPESTEKKITEIYYEDIDGNRIEELKVGMEVYVVIESENITGETVDVNLTDKNNDFLHNGEHLEDDILKGLTINSATHKEKLKVVAQHEAQEGEEQSPQNPDENTSPPPVQGEKEFTDYFLTDINGTKVEEYEVGDKIVLNIQTKNRIGDLVTISLDDKSHDFKYNGEILVDDQLTDYSISKDLEKIELEVIVQSS